MKDHSIRKLAEEALNVACLHMQKELGVTHGDYASIFFSDNRVEDQFVKYIKRELINIEDGDYR